MRSSHGCHRNPILNSRSRSRNSPRVGGVPRLVREVGPAVAKELILSCRPFSAEEALQLRFINRVVADDELVTEAEAFAESLASKPTFSLLATKTQVNAVMEEIAGTGRSANDADSLVVALHDEESRAASQRYLESRSRPSGNK